MFKDAKEELERLQGQLLAEEAPAAPAEDDELLSEQVLDQLLDTDYRSYNADRTDLDPQELGEELMKPEKTSLNGLIVTAGLLTLGIFLVVCWWLIRYAGLL